MHVHPPSPPPVHPPPQPERLVTRKDEAVGNKKKMQVCLPKLNYKLDNNLLTVEPRAVDQCCGSGSGIRYLFDPWIRDPRWVESQHPDPGSGMNNPDHIF
jgi:hypothetical protein